MLIDKPEFASFVERSLVRIHEDFITETIYPKLCDIKDFRFDKGHVPNYNTKLIQQLYLLKYLSVYLVEYKLIYEKLINDKIIDLDKLKILSIGAGCGLDYFGLYWALKTTNNEINILSQYKGIDIVNWDYKNLISNELTPSIIVDNVQKYCTINEDYNTIVFPKSIGEFDGQAFGSIKSMFEKSNFKSNTLTLISSMREKNIHIDKSRLKEIIVILENRGYSCANRDVTFNCEGGKYIHDFGITYPEEIKKYLLNINDNCKETPKCKPECSEVMGYHNKPVYKTEYINFQMIILERKEGVEIKNYDDLPF